jgi:hypothetical protein
MKSVQGQFRTRQMAQQAVAALQGAGVPADEIRGWNVIPESPPPQKGRGGRASGALTGALLGGVGGLIVGAAVGGVVDRAGAERAQLGAPSGVRVVVTWTPNGPDLAEILRANGASDVA